MRVGVTIFCQNYGDLNRNYGDWERYEVEEEGEAAPKRAVPSDCEIVSEEWILHEGFIVKGFQIRSAPRSCAM
jgi:hypothetical protein